MKKVWRKSHRRVKVLKTMLILRTHKQCYIVDYICYIVIYYINNKSMKTGTRSTYTNFKILIPLEGERSKRDGMRWLYLCL